MKIFYSLTDVLIFSGQMMQEITSVNHIFQKIFVIILLQNYRNL